MIRILKPNIDKTVRKVIYNSNADKADKAVNKLLEYLNDDKLKFEVINGFIEISKEKYFNVLIRELESIDKTLIEYIINKIIDVLANRPKYLTRDKVNVLNKLAKSEYVYIFFNRYEKSWSAINGYDKYQSSIINKQQEKEQLIQNIILKTIKNANNERAFKPLTKILKDNKYQKDNIGLIFSAISNIGKTVDKEVYDIITSQLFNEDYSIKSIAEITLEKIIGANWRDYVRKDDRFKNVVKSHKKTLTDKYLLDIKSENIDIKLNAIKAIGENKLEAAEESLIQMLGDNNNAIRKELGLALTNITGDDKWKSAVTGGANDMIRLGNINDKRVIAPLIKAFYFTNKPYEDKLYDINITAVKGLAARKEEVAVMFLIDIITGSPTTYNCVSTIREIIFMELKFINNEKAINKLLSFLEKSEDDRRRVKVIEKLYKIKTVKVMNAFIKALSYGSNISYVAAKGLSNFSDREEIIDPLITALEKDNSNISAIITLAKTKNKKAIESINNCFCSLDPKVKKEAAKALCELDEPK